MKRSFAYAAAEAQSRLDAASGELFAKLAYNKDYNAGLQESDTCANRHKGAPTSVQAHKRIRGGLSARREAVYSMIKECHLTGLTCDSLADFWKINPNSISGRFSELARDGRIEKFGTRKTRSGCPAAVWRAKP
jgi:hypothetical protein